MKKLFALLLTLVMVVTTLAACGGETAAPTEKPADAPAEVKNTEAPAASDLEGEIVFAIWDNNLMNYIDENDMVGKFQEKYPNAEVEVEKVVLCQ